MRKAVDLAARGLGCLALQRHNCGAPAGAVHCTCGVTGVHWSRHDALRPVHAGTSLASLSVVPFHQSRSNFVSEQLSATQAASTTHTPKDKLRCQLNQQVRLPSSKADAFKIEKDRGFS